MANEPVPTPPEGQFLVFTDGGQNLQVRLDGQTVWLTQMGIAELFQTTKQNVSLHLQNIFEDGELDPAATVKQYLTVQTEGSRQVRRAIDHYNLDAILAVGYRVRSHVGTAFRQWATARLSELLIKGFTMDDDRLKAGRTLGDDYFEELLARIRDIRSSERLFYQKITDIYATSIDYDKESPITREFFATVQNKLHWAIHGKTAAEIVRLRADASKPHMGLTTWKQAPAGPVRKADVTIAKNYLTKDELDALNRIVSMYLDYAEDQARRKKTVTMAEWVAKLDAFLQFNERNILTHAGKVSHQLAEEHAHGEFAKFDAERLRRAAIEPTSDFDKIVDEVKQLEAPPTPAPKPKKPGRKKKDGGE